MPALRKACLALPVLLGALGCQSAKGGVEAPVEMKNPGSGGGGGAQNLPPGAPLPPGEQATALLPARIRRLSDAEYQASVSALVGAAADGIAADFVPDSRQSGFTLNEAQRVDPVFAGQLATAATSLAAELRKHVGDQAPCPNPATDADKCAQAFITKFGLQAYRRPLADDEVAQLMTVFHTALDGGTYDEGIELVALSTTDQTQPNALAVAGGGAIFAWASDDAPNPMPIHAVRFDAGGGEVWATDVSTENAGTGRLTSAWSTDGYAAFAWESSTEMFAGDIHAQNVNLDGTLGVEAPDDTIFQNGFDPAM